MPSILLHSELRQKGKRIYKHPVPDGTVFDSTWAPGPIDDSALKDVKPENQLRLH